MKEDTQNLQGSATQTIYVKEFEKKSNGIGTAGFVLSLIAIFLGWIPFLGWIIWLLGVIFSFIGVFKTPNGLSIAGLIISFIGVIMLIGIYGAILGSAALL